MARETRFFLRWHFGDAVVIGAPRWLLSSLMAALLFVVAPKIEGTDRLMSWPFPCFLCDLYSEEPMGYFERELEQGGFKIDNASLLRSLRGVATPVDRAQMIDLLLHRNVREVEVVLLEILEGQLELPVPEEYLSVLKDSPRSQEEDETFLRRWVAVALVELGNYAGLDALRDLVHSTVGPRDRLWVAADLARFGDLSGFRYLVDASESENWFLRYSSMEGLSWSAAFDGTIFDGVEIDAVDRLRALGRDEEPKVRRWFVSEVGMIPYRGSSPWVYRDLVEDLAENDPDSEVRFRAGFLLSSGVLKERE